MSNRITPHVNLNGTSAEDLVTQRLAVHKAALALIDALKQMAPNGRDYPGDPDGAQRDRGTNYARIASVEHLRDIVVVEALAIKDAS